MKALYFQLYLLLVVLFMILYFFVLFCQGKKRQQVFNAEFMAQFDSEHQEAFGTKPSKGGYPDCGNGYYAQKLSYKDWYEFNNWQRAQNNFLETLTPVVVMTFMTAITEPLMACICVAVLIVGRLLYSLGYCYVGPKGRLVGAILVDLVLIALLVGSIMTIVNWPTDESNPRILPISYKKFTEWELARASVKTGTSS